MEGVRAIYSIHFGVLLATGRVATAAPTNQAIRPTFADYRNLNLKLKPGMSEQNVIDLLGQPTSSKLTSCAQALGQPWPCKIFVYGSDGANSLAILFRSGDSTGTWVVSSSNADRSARHVGGHGRTALFIVLERH